MPTDTEELICVRCGLEVRVNRESYEIFERMHYACFHFVFEHMGFDPDEECDAPGCPSYPRLADAHFAPALRSNSLARSRIRPVRASRSSRTRLYSARKSGSFIAVKSSLSLIALSLARRCNHCAAPSDSSVMFWQAINMAGNSGGNPVSHFGRQVRKERLARGWSLEELARRTGVAAGHWSRIENGRRPPTELTAARCDEVFPERRGYFSEYYDESRSWMPPGFRDWSEIENKASTLRDWTPSIITGLLQTEAYARALLETSLGVTAEAVATRLANRMARHQGVLLRDDPPRASFVVDEFALLRLVGSPEIMAGQMRHLAIIAAMPNATVQILPAIAHPANASGFAVTDDAALCEHVRGAYVFTDDQTVSSLLMTFDRLRGECYRVSESVAMINRTESIWATGASPLTATPTAATASKSPQATRS